ncbi:Small auxin-up RNA [Sesbania bispinosa]|nr:Small auxin-up RNA [Sesbania bispinosa]
MDFVKKCKKVWGISSKRLHPAEDSGSYGKLSSKKKAPHGYLSVYVGPERQRFVIKIKIANHPLFKTLLDAAEKEHGYTNDGPLWLPCDVDFFCEALAEMEDMSSVGCAFPIGQSQTLSIV